MKCPMCDNELEGKQSYCSPGCRKKASREKTKGDPTESHEEGVVSPKLTDTDQLFEEVTPDYYKYHQELFDKVCVICQKKYQTNLPMRKFCSPDCEERIWELIAGNGKIKK